MWPKFWGGVRQEVVCCGGEHVVANVLQMASILIPRSSWRDVVSGAFASYFSQELHLIDTLRLPCFERCEKLEAV